MPTPMHHTTSQDQLQRNIGTSAPPAYSDSQVWSVTFTPYPSRQWPESPPAYDTLTDLPLGCVSPPESQLNPPTAVPQWCRPPQAASHNASSNVPARYSCQSLVNNTPTAQQHNAPPTIRVSNVSSNSPTRNPRTVNTTENSVDLTRFLERKNCNPRSFGSVLNLVAFVQLGNGIGLSFDKSYGGYRSLSTGIVFWAPVFYLITGCFTICICNNPSFCKIKSLLSLNLLSLALGCVGLALSVLDLQDMQNLECPYVYFQSMCKKPFTGSYIIYYFLIASNVLVIISSFSTVSATSSFLHYTSKRRPPLRTLS